MNFFQKLIPYKNQKIFYLTLFSVILIILLTTFFSPLKVLAILIAFFFLFLSFYKPESIILFLAVYLPLEPFLLKFVPDEIYVYSRYFSEGLIYLLLINVFFRVLKRDKKFIHTCIDLPFFLFLTITVISLIYNFVHPSIGLLGIRQIIRFILFFYIIVYLKLDKGFIKKIITIVLVLVFLESFLGLAQAFIGEPADNFLIPSERKVYGGIQLTSGTTQFWEPGQRVFATMGRYDQLGTFLSFWLIILIAFLYEFKREKNETSYLSLDQTRKALYFLSIISFFALLLTYSRASWFGFLLGFLFISLILKKDKRVLAVLIFLIITAISWLAYSGLVVRQLTDAPRQPLVERFFEAFSYERWRGEYYGLGRVFFIVNTPLKVLKLSPLFGVGPGQYGGGAAAALHNTKKYDEAGIPFGIYGTDGYIDNNWLSLLGETGILGFLFYLCIFFNLFKYSLRVYKEGKTRFSRSLALGFSACLLAVSFQALLAQYLEVRTLAVYFWMTAAFVIILGYREGVKI